MANTQTGKEAAVAAAVDAWCKAMIAADKAGLEKITAAELSYGHSSGRSETKAELLRSAESHGWTLDRRVEVFELQAPDSILDPKQTQSLLYSSDLELGETVKMLFAVVDRMKPSRIVIDSLSEIRLLAQNSLRYRRQLLAMKHYFARSDATVLAPAAPRPTPERLSAIEFRPSASRPG